jgi:hypothetical protein
MHQISFPLWFAVIYTLCWVVLIVHELGHVLAAILTRQHIFDVHLGLFKPRWRIRLGNVALWLGLVPVRGFTEAYPVKSTNLRWRLFTLAAAGPLASGLLCFASWSLDERLGASYRSDNWFYSTLQPLTLLAGCVTVASLVANGKSVTDGQRLRATLFGGNLDARPYLHAFQYRHGLNLIGAGETVRGCRWLHRGMRSADFVRSPELRLVFAQFFVIAGSYLEDAKRLMREELDDPAGYAGNHAQWLQLADACASAVLFANRTELLAVAKQLTEIAVRRFPHVITLKGTLGSLCFELDDREQAESLLREVYTTSTAALDRGITAAYLAVFALRKQRQNEACEFVIAARENAEGHPLVVRVLKEAGLDAAGVAG